MQHRTITVDEYGRSRIVSVDGDDSPDIGGYGNRLPVGSEVELADGTVWIVEKVHSYIQNGNSGGGGSNYVAVVLVQHD